MEIHGDTLPWTFVPFVRRSPFGLLLIRVLLGCIVGQGIIFACERCKRFFADFRRFVEYMVL
jgi:hypothetical protein